MPAIAECGLYLFMESIAHLSIASLFGLGDASVVIDGHCNAMHLNGKSSEEDGHILSREAA
jgi:hypothetical protein